MDVSKNTGTPKSSILIGFSIINHPFWGPTPIFGNIQICCFFRPSHWNWPTRMTWLKMHQWWAWMTHQSFQEQFSRIPTPGGSFFCSVPRIWTLIHLHFESFLIWKISSSRCIMIEAYPSHDWMIAILLRGDLHPMSRASSQWGLCSEGTNCCFISPKQTRPLRKHEFIMIYHDLSTNHNWILTLGTIELLWGHVCIRAMDKWLATCKVIVVIADVVLFRGRPLGVSGDHCPVCWA